ncbi:MAG: 50S ribosomal protein L24 [Candidatus Harrisonbacteria bacterium CG10_big_fil_rev_8_21_14_0_10_44_23]|uniref:Large ribosomal subunit protein uL24 n=1 Tax=Candidatus Harrisonbacteria bacterium CG10_big_fil_rev_8_21_14_0_10_44_23 TaxID=1974585 RepID=A0A2H0USS0_9BACT|nr:MAG: 50S ribosomal protein L24 [Candidatus Harrisonbacteria bacterium CG10_big_fil_rev_8_21_14_0_10_44_23]
MKFKKGDTIRVIAGKDRGKTGKVLRINKESEKVLVEGINQYKKNKRPKKQGEKGEIVTIPMPIHQSNIMQLKKYEEKMARKKSK